MSQKSKANITPEVTQAVNEPSHAVKVQLAILLTELLASGEYEFEIPDDFIAGKFMNQFNDLKAKVESLEARIAELEKQSGTRPPAERVDAAALAKTDTTKGKAKK